MIATILEPFSSDKRAPRYVAELEVMEKIIDLIAHIGHCLQLIGEREVDQ